MYVCMFVFMYILIHTLMYVYDIFMYIKYESTCSVYT